LIVKLGAWLRQLRWRATRGLRGLIQTLSTATAATRFRLGAGWRRHFSLLAELRGHRGRTPGTSSLLRWISLALALPILALLGVTAHAAWDLNKASNGRFYLGLGSQVKGHNERRYGIPWTPPAPRMRDYIGAVRAVWRRECT
jgi:hypothetical protein